MEHTPIQSSNIASAAWEDGIQEIAFHGGKMAQYQIPQEMHEAFLKSESKGKFHAANIKGKVPWRYKGEKDWRKP